MPGVKKLFQESEDSAKPDYIHEHMFGKLGILAGSTRNWTCIPLSIRLHDGLQAAKDWKDSPVSGASHVVQMVEDACSAACTFGNALLLLNRYFLSVPALAKTPLQQLSARFPLIFFHAKSSKPNSNILGHNSRKSIIIHRPFFYISESDLKIR